MDAPFDAIRAKSHNHDKLRRDNVSRTQRRATRLHIMVHRCHAAKPKIQPNHPRILNTSIKVLGCNLVKISLLRAVSLSLHNFVKGIKFICDRNALSSAGLLVELSKGFKAHTNLPNPLNSLSQMQVCFLTKMKDHSCQKVHKQYFKTGQKSTDLRITFSKELTTLPCECLSSASPKHFDHPYCPKQKTTVSGRSCYSVGLRDKVPRFRAFGVEG